MKTLLRYLLRPVAVLGFVALAFAPTRAKADDDAVAMLRSATEEVLLTAYNSRTDPVARAAALRPTLEKHFAFDVLTKGAVGPGWNKMTAVEQKTIVDLFTTLVIRTYSDRFTPGEKPSIDYGSAQPRNGGRLELPTTITYAGSKFSVHYRVLKRDDTWFVYDVVIEGVSMVANYRDQFASLFQKGGADAIIRTLKDKLSSLSET